MIKKKVLFIVFLAVLSILVFGCAEISEDQPLNDDEINAEADLLADEEGINADDAISTVGQASRSAGSRIQFLSCTDTDNANNPDEAGSLTVTYSYKGRERTKNFDDTCTGGSRLREYYCRGDRYSYTYIPCSSGCTNGECNKECETDEDCSGLNCPQMVGGNTPECDLSVNECYCGGVCGDGYCDIVESRDRVCQEDCFLCSDGTPFGECSADKPKYCKDLGLVDECSICGCLDGQECQADGTCKAIELEAYFKFDYPPRPATFIFKLTDPAKIQEARDILSGRQTGATHVMGNIITQPADYNPPWSYHLDPDSVSFFEMAVEVCDAGIQYVEDHLEEVGGSFLPGNQWCPWGSRLIEEVGADRSDAVS